MKKVKNDLIIRILLFAIIVVCVIFIVMQRFEITSYKEDIESYEEKINSLENNEEDKEESKYYDCSFTQTYHIVNLLDDYIAEVPEKSYVIVDKFQVHGAFAHPIITNLKGELEVDKYYEFTYKIKGTGVITDLNDVVSHITDEPLEDIPEGILRVNLSIKETNKEGLEQIQENICKGN